MTLGLEIKNNFIFIIILLAFLSFELLMVGFGVRGAYMPNFIMCIVFSYAYINPPKTWLVALAVIISESFFSTTPSLMMIFIITSYIFITKILPKGGLNHRNFHIIIFALICMVVYSSKILLLYSVDSRPEVELMIIKMLVTIILFPLFYLGAEKIQKFL